MFTFLAKVSVVAALAVDLNPQPSSVVSVEALALRGGGKRKFKDGASTPTSQSTKRVKKLKQSALAEAKPLVERYLHMVDTWGSEPPSTFREKMNAGRDLTAALALLKSDNILNEVETYVSGACESLKDKDRSAEDNQKKAAEFLAEALDMSKNSDEFSKKIAGPRRRQAFWVALMHKWATAETPLVTRKDSATAKTRKDSKGKGKSSRSRFWPKF